LDVYVSIFAAAALFFWTALPFRVIIPQEVISSMSDPR
jgi:hypothetical protein